jgi:hypothetical protein
MLKNNYSILTIFYEEIISRGDNPFSLLETAYLS